MRRIDRARICLVIGVLLAMAGRAASEMALAGGSEQFALLISAGVIGWFSGIALALLGALFSAWLFFSEGTVVLQRSVRRLASADSQ